MGWAAAQLLISLPLGLLGLLTARWLWRRWLIDQRRQGRYASRTLVVGGKDDVEYVIRSLQEPGTGYQVVCATLTDCNAQSLSVDGLSYRVEGSYTTVPQAAASSGADTIIVASRPDGDPDFVKQLAWDLEGTAAELVLSSRLTDVAGPRISLRQVDGLPLIQVKIPTYEGTAHVLKRALDVVVATLALIPIALITPLLALLIKLDSPGPVFFRQERVGRDGELFPILKFRTMQTDAEQRLGELQALNEGSGPLFKLRQDPRVTRVGAVLRKFSLDELPQFWNVLRGEMSVVGPRPPLPSEVVDYDGTVSRRLYINPGITGPWRVSGRSDLSWDESVRLDLGYVENWSVMSDLMIMWRTARVMLQPSGAY
ncbi:sugar transferase [Microbacterium sp. NIBRBAC000506063]|uniref:sugar transferase n=1 Tax=Microbacterium sp. NIBRBAC000506063 TaxID=2734618 RepID=UPI001CB72706|nr:sugar transferase [Microbacterium sp. NIBRBAC000506063]